MLSGTGGGRGGFYRSAVIHREPLFAIPEQVHPYSNGEEKMTCRDSFWYTESRE